MNNKSVELLENIIFVSINTLYKVLTSWNFNTR